MLLSMRTITTTELATLLGSITHATPIGLTALTTVKAKRTGNPYVSLHKLVKLNVMTGASYEASVQRKQAAAGAADPAAPFEAAARQWGERIGPALVRGEGGQLYLAAHVNTLIKPRPLYLVPQPRPRGGTILTAIAKARIAPWLPADRTAEVAAHQGLPEGVAPVQYRNWKLESIVALTLGGRRYRVRHISATPTPL